MENDPLVKARDLLLNSEIEAADYKILKSECERKISALEIKLFSANKPDNNKDSLLNKAVNALSHIDKLYADGDAKKKREVIGSIFSENLTFDGFNYRTARLSEPVRLIYSLDKGFSENKNGQIEANFDLSKRVTPSGFKPETF